MHHTQSPAAASARQVPRALQLWLSCFLAGLIWTGTQTLYHAQLITEPPPNTIHNVRGVLHKISGHDVARLGLARIGPGENSTVFSCPRYRTHPLQKCIDGLRQLNGAEVSLAYAEVPRSYGMDLVIVELRDTRTDVHHLTVADATGPFKTAISNALISTLAVTALLGLVLFAPRLFYKASKD